MILRSLSRHTSRVKNLCRILLIDPLPVVRAGLTALVQRAAPQATVVVVGSAEQMRAEAKCGPRSLIVVDPAFEHGDGAGSALVRELRAINPDARILVFSEGTEAIVGLTAILAGANGFLPKVAAEAEIEAVLARLAAGGEHTSEALRERVSESRSPFARRSGFAALSAAERMVLHEFGRGQTVKDIARHAGVASSTIGTYRGRILKKLGLRTTADLVRYACEHMLP